MEQNKKTILAVTIIVVLIILVVGVRSSTKDTVPPVTDTSITTNPTDLPGMQVGAAPWVAEISHLKDRLAAIGLPALSAEGTVLHIHQHLDIFVDGQSVAVPPGIGINEAAPFISQLHVHDTTGVIHVESPTVQTFTLGQFFDVWGVKLTSDCIGGYANTTEKTLKVFVNGKPYTGDPRALALESHQEIAITYGTDTEMPKNIPASYNFPVGE